MNRREMLQASAAAMCAPIPDATTPDSIVHKYLAAEVERIGKNFMDGAKSKAEWLAKRPLLKQQFLDMAGLWPPPEKTDLKGTITGTYISGTFASKRVHFQSLPGLYVTGNLYYPNHPNLRQKFPAVLYLCGHSNKGRDGNKTAFSDHGVWFAKNGYVCLILDTLQLGELPGKHHGTYNLDRFWWHSRGYTPAGIECWNAIRAIDFLVENAFPYIDPNKIGVTGISGGGATTVWIAAADDRVKVAVPVSGMSDLESYISNRVINGHCDCMFVHNTYQWEWTTILALFAPKPLLFANSDNDPIFPMDGNRRIIAKLRQCYEMLGAKDLVEEYVSKGGHDYRPDLRIAIFSFFNKHLKGVDVAAKDIEFPPIEGKDLRVFPEDKDLPKDSINDKADETFVPKAVVKLPEAKDFAAWKAGLVKQLRERVFRAIPEKVPPLKLEIEDRPGARATAKTEGELTVSTLTLATSSEGKHTALIVLEDGDDPIMEAGFWMKNGVDEKVLVGLSTRGMGDAKWTRKSPPNTVERSLVLLGQTVDSGRVRDLIAVLNGQPAKVRLLGRGPAGIIAAYAALFAPEKVVDVAIGDAPTSHRDGPHFLNVQRVLDIPEALGLLAPNVKLTLLGKNAKDPAFDKVAAIFKLAGAQGMFKRMA